MYGDTSVLILGEAQRRKILEIPHRGKLEDIKLPKFDKKDIQKKKLGQTIYISNNTFYFL